MGEKELIRNLRQLRQIKPKKEWAFLAKKQILGETPKRSFAPFSIFSLRMVYAGLIVIFVFFGLFGFAQNSLPGDFLYPVKKISERAERAFVSKEKQPNFQLELAKKRLEELNRVAKDNQVERLAPAMKEYEKTKAAAEKAVVASIKNKPKEEAVRIAKEAAQALNKINKQEKKIYTDLGVDEPREEADGRNVDTYNCKLWVEYLIEGTATSTLSDQQTKDLAKVKEYYKMGDCEKALGFYLISSLNPKTK